MARNVLSKNKRKFAIRYIDLIFFNRYRILDAVIVARKENKKSVGVSSVYRNHLSSFKNFFSDPTAESVIKSLDPVKIIKVDNFDSSFLVKFPESWLQIVKDTFNFCQLKNSLLFNVITRYYDEEHWSDTCRQLNISNHERNRNIEIAQNFALIKAVDNNLISL